MLRQQLEVYEYFKGQFEEQRLEVEQAYKRRNELEEIERQANDAYVEEVVDSIRDAATDTSEYFKFADAEVDTRSLYTLVNTASQTNKKNKTFNVEIQVYPLGFEVETQVDIRVLKRDIKVEDAHLKSIAQASMKEYLGSLPEVPFPVEFL